MATYNELLRLRKSADLMNRIAVAAAIAAGQILLEDPADADRCRWATGVVRSDPDDAESLLIAYLGTNAGQTIAELEATTDAQLQAFVDAAVPGMVLASTATTG